MNRMHGIIFAYEQRGELRELTERRTAASMPFGGRYRAVDFALSNLLNAGVTDVGMVLHGRYQSMLDHVGSGKVWDMSRKRGGLHLLPPFNYLHEWGVTPFRGKMEALAGVRDYLNEIRQDYVVLMEGDLVANLPLADILEQHIRTHADITAVCGDDSFATENGTYFEKDPDGRIREVLFNMHQPRGYRSLDVFVMSTDLLRSLVDECQARDQYSFRRDVLQAKQDLLHLQSYTFSGFAAQIRSVQEYYDRSMQLLDKEIREDLFTSDRPIRAKGADKASTYIGPDGVCLNSLVAEGCRIEGTVTLDGEDIFSRKMDVNLLRKRVGMVFQKPNPFPMSIYDNVAYGPRTHGIRSRVKLDEIVEKSLRGAAIWDEVKDRLKKSALGMSGGQQQRLCIARALAVEPEVLLMDEPTSALDPISTSRIEELAMELKKDYTIVMVTHNMQQAARISDKTAFFLLGDMVEFGPTEKIFSMPQDRRTEDYITGRFG